MSASLPELEQDIERLLVRILKVDQSPARALCRSDVEQWDSLKHVEIVFALEDQYGVEFAESEFATMTSAAAIAALLRPRLAA